MRTPEPWKRYLDPDSGKKSVYWSENPKMFDFRFNTPIFFLNQGQGNVFKLRECAQSIFRMKLPPEIWFWERNLNIFRFSLQYTHLFPWIRVKEAFSRFGNVRNRFFAWFYPYIGCFGKKNFRKNLHKIRFFLAHPVFLKNRRFEENSKFLKNINS